MLCARRRRAPGLAIVLLALLLMPSLGVAADASGTGSTAGTSGSARVVERHGGSIADARTASFGPSAPALPPAPAHDVRLQVGDDFQRAVDAAPEGTRFLISRGVHRLQAVTPKHGMRFIGESGAVMSGARVLPASSFTRDGSRWSIGGQPQQGPYNAELARARMLPGFEIEERVEELFSDGRRLRRVASLTQVADGAWYFDHGAQRIWVGRDPATMGLIETSVSHYAFSGQGVRNVTIENLVVEKYATPAQVGAVGGWGSTIDWTVRHVEVRDNHGGGIRVGPGMLVENVKAHRMGQIGISGGGAGGSRPIVLRNTEITGNKVLNYYWGWEGGGTKFARVDGMVAENVWAHDNRGPGLWWDIDNRNVTARGNLAENNDQAGIFYEISYGTTDIVGNIARGNGRRGSGHEGAGIDISSSSNVTVRHNAVHGNRQGILVRKDSRPWDTRNVVVRDNDIKMTTGFTGLRDDIRNRAIFTSMGNTFRGNTYRLDSQTNSGRFLWDSTWVDAGGWRSRGLDTDGRFLDASGTPGVPPGIPSFTRAHYGPR